MQSFSFEAIDYGSPAVLKSILSEFGLAPQSKFGQNFLINKDAQARIISILSPLKDEKIWEIGPGMGALTHLLVNFPVRLTIFEIDKGFINLLEKLLNGRAEIISGDFIKTVEKVDKPGDIIKIVGNLPYNSVSSILLKIIELELYPKKMVFTVQEEMADRLSAGISEKEYSSFSILVQSHFNITKAGRINPGSFFPQPRVNSTIIEMTPSPERMRILDKGFYFNFVRLLFTSRRKTIKNNLKGLISYVKNRNIEMKMINEIFYNENLSLNQRPEEISVEKMINLCNSFTSAGKN